MINEGTFSIIIPTYNAGSQFEALLFELTKQSKYIKEIIVIDSSSNDLTVEIADKYKATVIKISKSEFDHGGTRNLGAKSATGEFLLFITQDVLPYNDNLLSSLSRAFHDTSIGGAYARQIPRVNANPIEALSRKYSYPEESRTNTYQDFLTIGVKALYFANPCACVRREVFIKVGGFPDKVICNEDMVIAFKMLKAGYKTAYVSDAIVYHSHDYSPLQLFKRYFDIGVFFKTYSELNSSAKNSSEGFSQTVKSIKFLIIQKQFKWIPKLFIETLAKMAGYKAGQNYKLIPDQIKKNCSMNKNFWNKK